MADNDAEMIDVDCVGGSYDGRSMSLAKSALSEGTMTVVLPFGVSTEDLPKEMWETYLPRQDGESVVMVFQDNLQPRR